MEKNQLQLKKNDPDFLRSVETCIRFLIMDPTMKYRGKTFNDDDISFIKGLIAGNPEASRFALSKMLCREWNWVQPNGALKDVVCRGFMLQQIGRASCRERV